MALSRSIEPLARLRPVIIDESDGELSSFPTALRLGYAGVSSKNCKGFYKSILNASRVAGLGPGHFMSAEDLTTLPGVSLQQDLALVSLLGMTHVERNAHHFVDGMSFASEAEQKAFVSAHRALYERKDGHPARLNFGDCFAYALARAAGEPLLFKGSDFARTDIAPALGG